VWSFPGDESTLNYLEHSVRGGALSYEPVGTGKTHEEVPDELRGVKESATPSAQVRVYSGAIFGKSIMSSANARQKMGARQCRRRSVTL